MKYISEKEYVLKMKKLKAQNISIERTKLLKEEKNKYKKRLKMPSTSKS